MTGHGRLILLAASALSAWLVCPANGFAKAMPAPVKAAPAKAAAPEPVAAYIYTALNGDTLSQLNQKYFVGADAIAQIQKANRIANANLILAGAPLRLPRAVLRDELTYAKIESFSGPVAITVGGQPLATKLGAPISENSDIQTGRNAFITLRLSDGTALSVPSQSEVRIGRMRKILLTGTVERDINIVNGRIHAQVIPMIDPNSTFRVITPLTVSAVRGTDFATAYNPGSTRSATMVEEGKVAVTRPAATIAAGGAGATDAFTLLPGFGAASGSADSTGVVKLLDEPQLVDPGAVQTGQQLQFTLKPEAGASAYHVQVSKDAGGLDIIAEDTEPGVAFTLPSVPAGQYFVHAFAIDANGLEGAPGTYNFQRVLNSVSAAMSQSKSGGLVKFLFKWAVSADGTPAIRFRMALKPPAAAPGAPPAPASIPIVDELDLKSNSLEIGNLPVGDYVWQVSSTLVSGGKVVETWSSPQTFHIVGSH